MDPLSPYNAHSTANGRASHENLVADYPKASDKASSYSPFEESFLDGVAKFLATHGPAFAKLSLIIGSAIATIYNALRASHHPGVQSGGLLMTVLIAAGLIVECGFAFAWSRKGTFSLAGKQKKTAHMIFNHASIVMIGDLSLSVAEIAFGIGNIAIFWVGIVQPIAAVHIVRLFYRIKGEHPVFIAESEIIDLQAIMKAANIRDTIDAQHQISSDAEQHRQIEALIIGQQHRAALKHIRSRRFKQAIRDETRKAISVRPPENNGTHLGKISAFLEKRFPSKKDKHSR